MGSMNRNQFGVVTFDVGNTLLCADPSPAMVYSQALGRHGRAVAPEVVAPVFADAWAEMQRQTLPGRDPRAACPRRDRYNSVAGGERAWWAAFLAVVLGRLDHDAPLEPLLDDLYAAFARPDGWRVFPETRPTLQALLGQGVRLAVISNWDSRLPELLGSLELDSFFEVITVSAIEGVEKPDPLIFDRTLRRLGVTAEQVIHVGDSPLEDYHGAADAGLSPVLIDRPGLFSADDFRRVDDLGQLPKMVQ